ncbi:MAG: neutral/alkaline non-lysosomal ceramidase N-terminal domain-containing protein [Myxococcales bacterium]|nr:neutral/alkaline non-lysosomal ceramidase N-terminal domain-containing protein [Myxococcales bacterium]
MANQVARRWQAGAGVTSLDLPQGAPLAGYFDRRDWSRAPEDSRLFHGATGTLDAIRAKALVLTDGDRRVALVSLDTVGISPAMRRVLHREIAPLGFAPQDLLLAATHTHSGPGGFTEVEFYQQLGADRYQAEIVEILANGIARAVAGAVEDLRPAICRAGVAKLPAIALDRRGGGDIDETIPFLDWRDESGGSIALQIHMACHSTILGADNLRFSADLAGAVERNLERATGAPVLDFASPCGNVVPAEEDGDAAVVDRVGRAIADAVAGALPTAELMALGALRIATENPELPPFAVREEQIPGPLGPILTPGVRKLRAGARLYEIGAQAITLGDWVIGALPGECTVAMGRRIAASMSAASGKRAVLVSLANGYIGYITTPEEHAAGGYEAMLNLFGAGTGPAFERSLAALAAEVSG